MLAILNALWWGFLRRWYGGLFPEDKYKVIGNRALQAAVMIISMMAIFLSDYASWQSWFSSVGISLWLYAMFWSKGHGAVLDVGRTKNPDISRYDTWFNPVLKWIYNKIGWGNKIHGYSYDMWWMGIRYTFPMIVPAILINPIYFLGGMVVPFIYEHCLRLEEKRPELFKYPCCDRANKLSEILVGFMFGLLIYIFSLINY